ncbi:MAG: hypothetical protein KAJ46_04980 [Sedimentisphaerales bacterium]|nr:hypothetical protein [Sedimentisphaerales bacterium]
MEKVSLWKRMGGWLRRPQTSRDGLEVVHHDAEGLVVEPLEDKDTSETPSTLSAHGNKKEVQLAALEGSFNRLVEVLESLNNNVVRQHDQNKDLIDHLTQTSDLMRALPENVEAQGRSVQNLAQEIKEHTLRSQQVVEIVKALPDLNRQQVDRLGDIAHQMEDSVESSVRMTESFNRFDGTVQGMLNNSKAQTASLANMGEMFEKNEQQLHTLIKQQNRRFTWLLVFVLLASVVGLGTVVAFLLLN